MNGEDLSPKTRELLGRPIQERIAYIQRLKIPVKLADFSLHQRRADIPRQRPGILIVQPPPEMHPHHSFFEDATSVCVEHVMVFAPKERLSESRGGAVIKPDDLRRGNHHRVRVPILF